MLRTLVRGTVSLPPPMSLEPREKTVGPDPSLGPRAKCRHKGRTALLGADWPLLGEGHKKEGEWPGQGSYSRHLEL